MGQFCVLLDTLPLPVQAALSGSLKGESVDDLVGTGSDPGFTVEPVQFSPAPSPRAKLVRRGEVYFTPTCPRWSCRERNSLGAWNCAYCGARLYPTLKQLADARGYGR